MQMKIERERMDHRFPALRPRLLFDRDHFRKVVDWSWPGRCGYAYEYSATHMGVTATTRLMKGRLRRLAQSKGWRLLQVGDTEVTVIVPDRDFPTAAAIVKLRRRRRPCGVTKPPRSALVGVRDP